MSKYTEAIKDMEDRLKFYECCRQEYVERRELFEYRIAKVKPLLEALQIADRLEQADAISNEEIYIKACKRYGCWESECPHRVRDKFCPDLAEIFFGGYNQALADIRGDNNG